jgi:hypothetical protein
MPTFTTDSNGIPIRNGTPTGDAGIALEARAAALSAHIGTPHAPAGSILMYGAGSAPSGWLLCNGASYLRATYAALFAVIGTTFGAADGTHFNVPDFTGRFPAQANGGTIAALGSTGGSATSAIGTSGNADTNGDGTTTPVPVGSDGSFDIIPPYLSVNFIIRT